MERRLPDEIAAMGTESGRFEESRNKFVATNGVDVLLSDGALTRDGLFFLHEFIRC